MHWKARGQMDKTIFGNKCTTFTVDAVSKVTGFRPDGQSMPQLGLFEAALKAHEDRVEGWAADGWPLPCIVLGGVCFVLALLSVLDGLKLPVFIFPKQSAICSGLAQCFDIIGRLRRAGARVAEIPLITSQAHKQPTVHPRYLAQCIPNPPGYR